MAIKAVLARCINCKTEVKEGPAYVVCTKCGDPVKPRARPEVRKGITLEPAESGPPTVDPAVLARMSALPDFSGTLAEVESTGKQAGEYVGERAVRLTPEQEQALYAIRGWYGGQASGAGQCPIFRLFGYAGVGKTTLARHLAGALGTPNIVFGAYTGKAAHVLRRKGVPATTIHSAIYCPVDNREARAEWERVTRELARIESEPAPTGMELGSLDYLRSQLADLEEAIRHGVQFELNPMSEWGSADLIVLDEVSMVNEKIALDIESFGVPVLVLGDPAQLPPVEGGGYYTAHRPDVLLTEVHRQALESPVLALATAVRKGGGWEHVREKVSLEKAMAADQILVWKNATRWSLIEKIRTKLERPAGVPVSGDRVQCLVNNRDLGVFNGAQFEVLQVRDGEFLVRDDDGVERWMFYDPDGFRGLTGEKEGRERRRFRGKVGLFTFANAITCHKAQGSEWDHVYVVDQTHQMFRSSEADKRAWIYTACTRASEKVTIASTEVRA